MEPQTTNAVTDTIPRASLESMVIGLGTVALASDMVAFDEVRLALQQASPRPGPNLPKAMLSTTRDVLADLRRLKLIDLDGPLPRASQELQKPCWCRATPAGIALARTFEADFGQGHDRLFALWYAHHPHFAAMIARLLSRPFFLPEFTGVKHLGVELLREPDPARFAQGIAVRTVAKLPVAFFEHVTPERVVDEVVARARDLHAKTALEMVADPQQAVEKIQDTVVAPAIIACERLDVDHVSLKHILRAAREFLACSSTTQLPECESRTYFSTCHIAPGPDDNIRIVHHGERYAEAQFDTSLHRCYESQGRGAGSWVDAYALRAQVCVGLGIQQKVFNRCLGHYVEQHPGGVGTELPFKSEPAGEPSISVRGKEISLIQLTF